MNLESFIVVEELLIFFLVFYLLNQEFLEFKLRLNKFFLNVPEDP
jgi:hypothetical protein